MAPEINKFSGFGHLTFDLFQVHPHPRDQDGDEDLSPV
jgi:hypothetical protein